MIDIEDISTSCKAHGPTCNQKMRGLCRNDCYGSKTSFEVDIAIVGAGVIGCSIARELSKYRHLNILLLEKESDVSQGASKANSGIIHGGYDAKHGTKKSQLSRRGNKMFEKLDEELEFGFKKIGSLVLAFSQPEVKMLYDIYQNGVKNGVDDLQILSKDQVRKMEPNISIGVLGALYCPSAGIVSPYEYCIALAENAIMNGVRLLLEHKVTAINKLSLTPGGEERFTLETKKGTSISAKRVINCAGLYADELAGFVHDRNFYIRARKGDYIVLDKEEGARINHVLFQAPTEKWGKGILVSPTARGNLLLGPSAIIQDSKEATDTDTHELAYVVWAARRTMPHLDTTKSLTSYAGLRSRSNVHDFIIEESRISPGFFNVAGIESPGLTASPAIALEVVNLLKTSGLLLEKKSSEEFNRLRKHPVNFSANKLESVKNSVDGKEKTIICKCENITEAEINRALNSGIEIRCTDSIKWRTRAGMGWCQGARCRPLVAEMIAAKLGNGVRMQDVPKNMPSKEAPVRESRNFLSKL